MNEFPFNLPPRKPARKHDTTALLNVTAVDDVERELRALIGTTIEATNPKDKGWRAQAIARLLGDVRDNLSAPDSFGHELKSVTCCSNDDGVLRPRERRLAVCMVDDGSLRVPFIRSVCWQKLQRFLLVGFTYEGKWASSARIEFVRRLAFQDDKQKYKQLEEDYEHFQRLAKRKGFNSLSRADRSPNGLLQIATKGPGGIGNKKTRAFYLLNRAL
jgi:hypothetical protein